ncbi:polyprenol monophosphomannose synthase [Cryptosporangium phraense]|uniref:Polyprenol monophosphomannose synthase n=1 Tax=Cryptosporangium phraense TaxID=2593070 RepID=A0A545AG65_9ACTN|nr:polyprenol monophosphomannose synthase [Cryptosporangium phraense]TQS40314.1 polyprenol monophosphomannose synthase [Cryptosporangium phraense]
MATLCVIPTYNEAETIVPLLTALLTTAPDVDVLVVDDGSPDGTARLVERLAGERPQVHLLERTAKEGLGAAYRAGFAWGLSHGYDLLVEMDADLSHDPDELPTLLAAVEAGADLVIGSRYAPGGSTVGWSKSRRALSRAGNLYVRALLGLPVRDSTAGYRVFRREVLERLPVGALTTSGYCFQIDTVYRAWLAGFRVVEVPVTFRERVAGSSKMSRRIVTEAIGQVTRWSWTNRRRGPRTAGPAVAGVAGVGGGSAAPAAARTTP